MKMARMIFLIGSFAVVTSGPIRAVPLDITWNGGTPIFLGESPQLNPGFQDSIPLENLPQALEINLAGVNSIDMTWNAPAGYMYVVNPVPAGFDFSGLTFEAIYGQPGQASSLGSITASSLLVHTIYGTSPLSGGAFLSSGELEFLASAGGTGFAPFAFNSITISANFSGTGTSQSLGLDNPVADPLFPFGELYGGFSLSDSSFTIPGNVDLASLLTLKPLPSGSAPDASSTMTMAGMGFAVLLLVGRKGLPVKC